MNTNLAISLIRADGGAQPRAGLIETTIAAYAEAMQQGAAPFPAITVFYDGQAYWLADGFHRMAAAQRIGKSKILADVQQGTQRDAILYSVGANARHGLPRSNEDKRRAVLKLLNDAEWRQWSDREIARRCSVSHPLVAELRKEVFVTGNSSSEDIPNAERSFVTRHGTPATMQTGNIGATAYMPMWQLEQCLMAWLNRQTTDRAGQITLLVAIQERTTRGLVALDDFLAAPELATPRRKGDVQQAVNNVLEHLRQAEAKAQVEVKAQAAQTLPSISTSPLSADTTLQLATTAQMQTGVTSWLANCSPGDGRAVLQAIDESTSGGQEHLQTIFDSQYLPDNLCSSGVPAASANLLPQMVEAETKAEVEVKTLTSTSAFFPLTIGRTTIVHADSRRLDAHVAPGSAHLVVTSPPYNVGMSYGAYDDNRPEAEYLALLHAVFVQCHQALTDGGRIAVVVPHGRGRQPWRPLAARVAADLADLGFSLRGEVIWDKLSTGNRTTWGSWESSSNPVLRDRTEAIIVAHKGRAELASLQPLPADWLPGELFMALTQDLWAVRAATNVPHPAPFPVELVERLIRLYAFPDAHIVDPFGGSGTTAVAAARLGCRATVVDVDAAYCELAVQRLRQQEGNHGL